MPTIDLSHVLHGQFLAWLLAGVKLSLLLTLIALLSSLPLATLVALARLSPVRVVNRLAWGYVETVRNVPLLAHLLFWYFAVPELLPEDFKAWLYAGHIEAIAAVSALVVYTTAYMAEDIRSGIRSVPHGQWLAARSLGMGWGALVRWVVLPQAVRAIVPPLISQTLNLWKNTSIASVIGTAELMTQAQRVESASFRGFETFLAATLVYLSVSLAITAAGTFYQWRYPVRAASR
ncbi:polar amino acid transport system permease protein [Roseateles sp. YR242]|uniref:amino acid ABC transporter permease n=1 Tax=Roseateles sp. YR242 TaxID=1855305 RepID=UPI0008CA60CF|nr:amino acid ABC transporter permease [Roseateles sp. YR242]SEL39493.1 polar amino acid transport system permease protein [Roseateles sp. YR242]